MWVEKWQEPGQCEALADTTQMAVRSHTAGHRQRREKVLHSCHRRQLMLEGGGRPDGKRLEKRVG
jgi:hypothetical protein